jgi:hypothetical protein
MQERMTPSDRASQAATPENPMPFIVGVARSGTTLLRLMLDAHPDMAIPPETLFPQELLRIDDLDKDAARKFADLLIGRPNWGDFHLSADALRSEINHLTPFSVSSAFRCFYRLYAARFGKTRWGDKTPSYAQYLNLIEQILPEAHFIHIIRDGRAVALSHRTTWNDNHPDGIRALAADWLTLVTETRRQAATCSHYMEVRYEQLVCSPAEVLREICSFIGVPFCESMLQYHLRAAARVAELGPLSFSRGEGGPQISLTPEERMAVHAAALASPDVSRIDQWRSVLSHDDIECFQDVAGSLLTNLRYPILVRN